MPVYLSTKQSARCTSKGVFCGFGFACPPPSSQRYDMRYKAVSKGKENKEWRLVLEEAKQLERLYIVLMKKGLI
jgi:hypothetical protein